MADRPHPFVSLEALLAQGEMLHGDILTAFRLSSNASNPDLLRALNFLTFANASLKAAIDAEAAASTKKES